MDTTPTNDSFCAAPLTTRGVLFHNVAPHALELLVLVSALWILIGYFPGEWGNDTYTQYGSVASGSYSDWHPPIMALLWRFLNRATGVLLGVPVEGSATIFLLHWALFYGGLWAVVRKARDFCARLFARSPLALGLLLTAAALYFWSPRTVTCVRFVLKDTGMAAAFLAAFGLLLWAPTGRRLGRGMAAAACVLLYYGTALRHNATPAVLPLLWLAADHFWPGTAPLRRLAITTVLLLAVLAGAHVTNYWVAGASRAFPAQIVMTADILAIGKRRGEFLLPPSWKERATMTEEHFKNFFEIQPDIFRLLNHPLAGVPSVGNPDDYKELRSFWLDRVRSHPGDWIKVRAEFFGKLMRRFDIAGLRYDQLAVLCLAALLWQATMRRKELGKDGTAFLMLGLSGLLYAAPYLIMTTGYASRLLYWYALACPLFLARFLGTQRLVHISARTSDGETRVTLHIGRPRGAAPQIQTQSRGDA